MISLQAKLRASLSRLQKKQANFYFMISEQFKGNPLVHEKWLAIGNELEKQVATVKTLPPSYWKMLNVSDAKSLLQTVTGALNLNLRTASGEVALRQYFTLTMDLEEPIILHVYAPIVRMLRASWTDRSLDLYVMIRSHLTRLIRLIEPFCGEPLLTQRCALLVQRFEQELQRSLVIEREVRRKDGRLSHKPAGRVAARAGRKAVRAAKEKRTIRTRQAIRAGGPRVPKSRKPLVTNIKLARRRARG
jgi:hypothetical protein